MNKFPEGFKFFMDVSKKKFKQNNAKCTKKAFEQDNKTPHITPDVLQNSCFYCEKVFFNSRYLLKHLLRRHSDEVVNFHKKFSKSDPCDLKSLFTFLEAEFSELKNEIFTIKQAMGLEYCKHEEEPLKKSKEIVCYPAKLAESSRVVLTDSHSIEVKNFESKLNNIEDKVQLLCSKFEENDKSMYSKFLSNKDFHQYMSHKEEKILQKQEAQFVEMMQVLLTELKTVLDKRLYDNDIDWKTKMTELKTDIFNLDQALAAMKKQISSPEHLQSIERKLENQIFHFLDNIGQTAMKRKSLKPKTNSSSKPKADSLLKPYINSASKSKTDFSPNIKASVSKKMENQVESSPNNDSPDSQSQLKCNLYELNGNQDEPINNSNITPENLRALIAEKLSSFGIFHDTSRLSNSEYEEKMRLLNTNKDYLKMLYYNFSDVYNCINISADQRVHSKLKPKQKRKLRFSEPLILKRDISSDLLSNKTDFLNKTCPVLKEGLYHSDSHHQVSVSPKPAIAVPKSKGFLFQDDFGSGDGFDKFQENNENHMERMFDSTEMKKFHTSSPVTVAKSVSKSRNIFSQNSSYAESNELSNEEEKDIRCDAPVMSAPDIVLDDDKLFDKRYVKSHSNKIGAYDKISEEDEESLDSLSSLEDDSFANNPIK